VSVCVFCWNDRRYFWCRISTRADENDILNTSDRHVRTKALLPPWPLSCNCIQCGLKKKSQQFHSCLFFVSRGCSGSLLVFMCDPKEIETMPENNGHGRSRRSTPVSIDSVLLWQRYMICSAVSLEPWQWNRWYIYIYLYILRLGFSGTKEVKEGVCSAYYVSTMSDLIMGSSIYRASMTTVDQGRLAVPSFAPMEPDPVSNRIYRVSTLAGCSHTQPTECVWKGALSDVAFGYLVPIQHPYPRN
jgi:hypothetical protein